MSLSLSLSEVSEKPGAVQLEEELDRVRAEKERALEDYREEAGRADMYLAQAKSAKIKESAALDALKAEKTLSETEQEKHMVELQAARGDERAACSLAVLALDSARANLEEGEGRAKTLAETRAELRCVRKGEEDCERGLGSANGGVRKARSRFEILKRQVELRCPEETEPETEPLSLLPRRSSPVSRRAAMSD